VGIASGFDAQTVAAITVDSLSQGSFTHHFGQIWSQNTDISPTAMKDAIRSLLSQHHQEMYFVCTIPALLREPIILTVTVLITGLF
jgi:hypothetical protein